MNRFLAALCALMALSSQLFAQTSGAVVNVNSSYTCDPTNRLLVVSSSAGSLTITLPRANATSQVINIVVVNGTNAVTVVKNPLDAAAIVDPAGDAFMGGANGANACSAGEAVAVESDGLGKWIVISARNGACGNWVTSSSTTTAQAAVPKANGPGQMTYWDNTNHQWVLTTGYTFPATINTTSSIGMRITTTGDTGLSVSTTGATGLSVSTSNAMGLKVSTDGNTGMEIRCKGQFGSALSTTTHYMDFVDGNGANGVIRGSITGQNTADLNADPDYQANIYNLDQCKVIADFNVAMATASEVTAIADAPLSLAPGDCVGLCLVACGGVIAVDGAQIAVAAADAAIALINLATSQSAVDAAYGAKDNFVNAIANNLGVNYSSSAGDYAEWLPKITPLDRFLPGQIVGIQNGRITKNTEGATQLMVISQRPIVLGNVPEAGKENEFEKVAFLGQVPVRVAGQVNQGDYILPSGLGNGEGIAVPPAKMRVEDYRKIVGVAWASSMVTRTKLVNVSVGLNGQAVGSAVVKQQTVIDAQAAEIRELNTSISRGNDVFGKMVPGFAEAMSSVQSSNTIPATPITTSKSGKVASATTCSQAAPVAMNMEPDVNSPGYLQLVDSLKQSELENSLHSMYHLSRADLERGFELAFKLLEKRGQDLGHIPYVKRYATDPAFKESQLAVLEDRIQHNVAHFQDLLSRRATESSVK